MPGAAQTIIEDLSALGLRFDAFVHDDDSVIDGVLWQGRRTRAYARALQRLIDDDLVYACSCSRKDLQRAASAPHVGDDGPPYPGTCRDRGLALDAPDTALRVRMDRLVARFGNPHVVDAWQGPYAQDVVADVGDIVVRRKDGLFSYQLAVVVDDGLQGITEVVRGVDLLSSAPRQVLLHRALGQAPPSFAHLPVLIDDDGHRLSKRSPNAPGILRALLEVHRPERVLGHLLWLTGSLSVDDNDGENDSRVDVDVDGFIARLNEEQLARAAISWRPITP